MSPSDSNSEQSSYVFSGSAEIVAIAEGATHIPAVIKSLRLEVSPSGNGSQETTGKGR